MKRQQNSTPLDPESTKFLAQMSALERAKANQIPGVRTVLVVLSAAGLVFDIEAIRQKVLLSYPDATVFFQTTDGKPMGAIAPMHVDLLIDLTGPRQRQTLFHAKKLRRMTRVAVGRNTGFFRRRIYDRVLDDTIPGAAYPNADRLDRERITQRQVLELAGVIVAQNGECPPDKGRTLPRELPLMQHL